MEELAPRQQEILEYIAAAIDQRGVAPSFREIGDALGIRSTNGVADHIKALERKGWIERVGGRGRARSIRLTDMATGSFHDESTVAVPLIGRVAAGIPSLAEENFESTVRVDSTLVPAGIPCFALTVCGESMIEAGILDGDVVIVKQQKTARDGETVVVRVADEATVKHFWREKGRIRLQPANSSMEPIYVDATQDVEVLGKVISLIRTNIY
ncbi:MAG: transcriptional repressor LexA [Proteobacteria bacterium]|nr:transcriptional repressor LexA [Pseudomonadota bacterium]MCP4921963.1 transcriptional repressor LexA [Pseudomonadota bacterium]